MATPYSSMLRSARFHARAVALLSDEFWLARGNAVHAAKRLDVSHSTLRRWCQDYPDLQRELDSIRAECETEDARRGSPA